MKQQRHAIRQAISTAVAVAVAMFASLFVPISERTWLVLATFLASQRTLGTPLRQAISCFLLIISALLLVAFLDWLHYPWLMVSFVGIIFIISAYLAYLNRPLANKTFYRLMLFSIAVLIAGLNENSFMMLSQQIIGVIWGLLIAVFFNHFFFPVAQSIAFGEGVIPILETLRSFALAFQKKLEQRFEKINLSFERSQIEKTLLSQQGSYPEWVYEAGFNPGLRSSWRFFLIHVERLTEICFSLHYLVSQEINFSILYMPLANVLQKNAELITILIYYFKGKEFKKSDENYTHDLDALESALKEVVPQHIEAIDLAPEYVVLTAMVRDLRDMRGLLLQLVMGLT